MYNSAEALRHITTRNDSTAPDHLLTEREQAVLQLMVQGMNNNEIANTLIVSRSTVKFHVSNILAKLHASSRTGAVAYALQHKLIAKLEV